MWLHGPAGAGKTAIARSIAEWCHDENLLLASYFFRRSDDSRNNVRRFIATLAYSIALSIPLCRPLIEQAISSDPHIFTRSLETQFRHVVLGPLQQVHTDNGTIPISYVFVIDGLDECLQEEEQKLILRLFGSIPQNQMTSLKLKILVASRPEQAIRLGFDYLPIQDISARIGLNEEYRAYDDIAYFMEDRFGEIKRKHPRKSFIPANWPSSYAVDNLVIKSTGQFIYAAIVVKYVSSDHHSPVSRLESILNINRFSKPKTRGKSPFAELDALYAHIIQTAIERCEMTEAVMQMVALSIRYNYHYLYDLVVQSFLPTAFHVAAAVLALDVDDASAILSELASIIEVTSNSLSVYHASLEDFLFDKSRSVGLWVDEFLITRRITQFSLLIPYLFDSENHLWFTARTALSDVNDLSSLPPTPMPRLEVDWPLTYEPNVRQAVNVHLVHTLKMASEVYRVKFSQDGWFLVVGLRTGEVYIYDIKKLPTRILVEPSEKDERFIPIRAVQFSEDNKHVAIGWSDGRIKVWHISKRRAVAMFNNASLAVGSVHFSPNGRFLISGYSDNSVRIWCMRGGSSKKLRWNPNMSEVTSIAPSPDGRYVASASSDGTLGIWEFRRVQLLERWGRAQYWSGTECFVAFTSDGQGLLSGGDDDRTLKLWNVNSLTASQSMSMGGRVVGSSINEETEKLTFQRAQAFLYMLSR